MPSKRKSRIAILAPSTERTLMLRSASSSMIFCGSIGMSNDALPTDDLSALDFSGLLLVDAATGIKESSSALSILEASNWTCRCDFPAFNVRAISTYILLRPS